VWFLNCTYIYFLNAEDLDFKIDEREHIPDFWQFEYYWRPLSVCSTRDDQELLDEASRLLELATQDYKVLGGLSGINPVPSRKEEDELY
jgi:hypothetical protein